MAKCKKAQKTKDKTVMEKEANNKVIPHKTNINSINNQYPFYYPYII